MKSILLVILFLLALKCCAQDSTVVVKDTLITIPLRWGRGLENSRQKAILFEQQVKDDGVIIDKLEKKSAKQEEELGLATKTVAAQDSTIKEKDKTIKAKDIIIANPNHPIKWWHVAIGVAAGFLAGEAL